MRANAETPLSTAKTPISAPPAPGRIHFIRSAFRLQPFAALLDARASPRVPARAIVIFGPPEIVRISEACAPRPLASQRPGNSSPGHFV
jgi:hypothetical protein